MIALRRYANVYIRIQAVLVRLYEVTILVLFYYTANVLHCFFKLLYDRKENTKYLYIL